MTFEERVKSVVPAAQLYTLDGQLFMVSTETVCLAISQKGSQDAWKKAFENLQNEVYEKLIQ